MGIDIPGGAAGKLAVPAERLVPIPADLPPSTAVLLQVLGTCVHAQQLVDLFPGQRAAVIGLGVSGLLHIQLLHARGLDVVAVGRSPAKLELARRIGATEALTVEQAREWAREPARQFDILVEAAGAEASLALATDLANPGATLLVFGIHGRSTPAPFQDFYVKELAVINARGATSLDYESTVQLVSAGRLDLSAIEIRRYPLTESVAAFKAAAATSEVVKFVLEP